MPGLLRGVARTAVVAGTASAVSGRVQRRQADKFAERDAHAAAQRSEAYAAETGAPPAYAPPTTQYGAAPQQVYAAPPPQEYAPAPAAPALAVAILDPGNIIHLPVKAEFMSIFPFRICQR